MRDKITLIIFLSLIILLIVAMWIGIGGLNILSISELKQKDEQVNTKIEEASKMTSINYPKAIDNLEKVYEKYEIQKQKYEELSDFTDEGSKQIYETKQYDIGYLWKIFGKYATSRNLTIEMEVKKTTAENLYDLYFSIKGQYVNISQFIYDIENNSDLFFRIYDFKMSGSSEIVLASFKVKDVNIDPSTITTTSTTVDKDKK